MIAEKIREKACKEEADCTSFHQRPDVAAEFLQEQPADRASLALGK
jgi:hypothetical protein